MTNEELTAQVLRYCSLGEIPEVYTPNEYDNLELTDVRFVSIGDGDGCFLDCNDNFPYIKYCTIKLHALDSWIDVILYYEFGGRKDIYTFKSALLKEFQYREQWVNDLLYKYNICVSKELEQHENIEIYEKD